MASAPLEKLKSLWNSQVMDEEQWAVNYRVLKAGGLFAGSIFLMRAFGDLMFFWNMQLQNGKFKFP